MSYEDADLYDRAAMEMMRALDTLTTLRDRLDDEPLLDAVQEVIDQLQLAINFDMSFIHDEV